MKNKPIVILLFTLFITCKPNKTQFDILNSYVIENQYSLDSVKSIFVLQENNCIGCNKSFAILLQKHLNDKNTITIISAIGKTIDISPFDNHQNVIMDYNMEFRNLELFKSSAMIILNQNKVDTIVEIKAKGLKQTLEYISNRL